MSDSENFWSGIWTALMKTQLTAEVHNLGLHIEQQPSNGGDKETSINSFVWNNPSCCFWFMDSPVWDDPEFSLHHWVQIYFPYAFFVNLLSPPHSVFIDCIQTYCLSQCSSVSIMISLGYELDERGSITGWDKILCLTTRARPGSYPVGNTDCFAGCSAVGAWTLPTLTSM